jgi:hypothetical protein
LPLQFFLTFLQEFVDTKGVIRIRQLKKVRQHNGQKKKDKKTNNDILSTTQKTRKVDLVITDTPAFQILNEPMTGMSRTLNIIRKPRKSLFSKRKGAITYER